MVKFASNQNAQVHFKGVSHENRLMTARMNAQKENAIWCDLCCCQLNTVQMLDVHKQSPKHLKKVNVYNEIMQLKEEYLGAKTTTSTAANDDSAANT